MEEISSQESHQVSVATKDKTKRPQLSCNPCRSRKVKCDRIQPCSACSLHQIAEVCHYDLSEAERQPILQAEAIREKDKTIASLRREVAALKSHNVKPENDATNSKFSQVQPDIEASSESESYVYRGLSPQREPIVDEYCYPEDINLGDMAGKDQMTDLTFDRRPHGSVKTISHGVDVLPIHMANPKLFSTLWTVKDEMKSLTRILPAEADLSCYLASFVKRSQGNSFPYLPQTAAAPDIRQYQSDLEHNETAFPEVLALLFSTLALGLQDGIYDRSGEKWIIGTVESEFAKGDVYVAAAMQCLRQASFVNKPTMLTIETLVMIGSYLNNNGRFLDASALFGGTVRLAQRINLHRDPARIGLPTASKEAAARRWLWWCILHMDQHYSMTLGRPLAVSSIGDCSTPDAGSPNALPSVIARYTNDLTTVVRAILGIPYLSNERVDQFTDEVLLLQNCLPHTVQFDASWLQQESSDLVWPLHMQATLLYAKTHNVLISLNRRRTEYIRRDSGSSRVSMLQRPPVIDACGIGRGRPRVLASCRALLTAFEFYRSRLRAGMICWTMGQMAFNASMLLTLSMLETGETQDLIPVQYAYSTFLEMNKLGIHRLAGIAVERLGRLMKEFRTEDSSIETVMGQQGMLLLEDPEAHLMPKTTVKPTVCGADKGPTNEMPDSGTVQRSQSLRSQRKRSMRKVVKNDIAAGENIKKKRSRAASSHRLTQRRWTDCGPLDSTLLSSTSIQQDVPEALTHSLKSPGSTRTSSSITLERQTSPTFASPVAGAQDHPHIPFEISVSGTQDQAWPSSAQRFEQQFQQFQQTFRMQQQQSQIATAFIDTVQQQQQLTEYHDASQQQSSGMGLELNGQVGMEMNDLQLPEQVLDFSNAATSFTSDFFKDSLVASGNLGLDDHQLPFDQQPFAASPFSISASEPFGGVQF